MRVKAAIGIGFLTVAFTVLLGARVPSGCNEDFYTSLTGSIGVAALGPETRNILVRVVNKIGEPTAAAFARITYLRPGQAGQGPSDLPLFGAYWQVSGVPAGGDMGQTLPCEEVSIIGLGDVSGYNALEPENSDLGDGAWVVSGNTVKVIPIDSSLVLQNGVDFRCGDTITFVFYGSAGDYHITWQVINGENAEKAGIFDSFEKEANDYYDWLLDQLQ